MHEMGTHPSVVHAPRLHPAGMSFAFGGNVLVHPSANGSFENEVLN
jgi:hypothetical protein